MLYVVFVCTLFSGTLITLIYIFDIVHDKGKDETKRLRTIIKENIELIPTGISLLFIAGIIYFQNRQMIINITKNLLHWMGSM